MPDEQLRYCPRCETSKSVDEFYRNGNGWTTYCKPCNRSYAKERHKNKKDKKLQRAEEYKEHTTPNKYSDFELFEPFDCPPRPDWLVEIAKKHDVELKPEGSPFQTGLLLDCTETPGYTLSIAGSQVGKSRALLIEAIIMATGKIPFSMQYDKGVDTGIPRKVTRENIIRFGTQPDGTCGNVIGVGKYPKEKIPPPNSGAQIWIASYAEVKHKMWETRLKELIPESLLELNRNGEGWNYVRQMFTFKTGAQIRLITYEQKYKKTEGEMAWMIILDEEPPLRDYFISATEHCKYLRLCFSPINGIAWSYFDAYLPAIQNKSDLVKIFSCTQFDSPFQDRVRVEAKLKTYKAYEIKTRIFGQFSEMAGKPYYTYEIAQQHLKRYMPRHTLIKFMPMSKPETVREMLDIKVRAEPAEEPSEDVWEVYEKYSESDAYWLSADVAKGDENPDIAGNTSVAYVRRLPRLDEKEPVMVAALQSRLRNVEFAWNCLYSACYYNMALIAPETGISADGAVFATTLANYPYLYRHTSTNYQTKALQSRIGFDTKSGTRKIITDLVGTWIYNHLDNSKIYHYPLLKEISEAIVGKDGKCDHPERGSTDCIISYGISCYVYEFCKNQIRNNRQPDKDEQNISSGVLFPNILGFRQRMKETRPVIGSRRGLDARFGYRKMMSISH
jgi:hypothetical protein